MLHWNGFGGDANMTAAYDAFMRGAEREHSDSLYNLGTMCQYGIGTPRNDSRAMEFFLRADAVGHWRAAYSLAALNAAGGSK